MLAAVNLHVASQRKSRAAVQFNPRFHNFMSNQTVFVLGAGFSCLAGIPLMNELRDEVFADPRIQDLPAFAGQDKRAQP